MLPAAQWRCHCGLYREKAVVALPVRLIPNAPMRITAQLRPSQPVGAGSIADDPPDFCFE